MLRWFCMLLALLLAASAGLAEEGPVLGGRYGSVLVRSYQSETLQYTIERFELDGAVCYLTGITMADPGRQIRKGTAKWKHDIRFPSDIAKSMPGNPALVINGSGYVSPVFPGIPDNYPGTSRDYFYTPLGSLTVTNGQVLRNLAGVPYYGLTLQEDGLHLHVGEDNDSVLAAQPRETWSFYVKCPLIQDGSLILDTEWDWAQRKALRNVICDVGNHTYLDLMVTNKNGTTLSLVRCAEFVLEEFHPVWAYNLDGGPSVALLARRENGTILKTIYGNNSKDFDVMAFYELQDAPAD